MKKIFLPLLLLSAALVILVAQSCTGKESCDDDTPCAQVPDNRIPDQLIIELKNFYTMGDITGPRDSFGICPNGDDPPVRVDFNLSYDPDLCSDACYTGKAIFLEKLNNVVYGEGYPRYIEDFTIIDTCKCAEEIILIQLKGDLPKVNIYNGVVAGTSKTKEENNGVIGAIGYNYDLKDIGKFNDQALFDARGPELDSCEVITSLRYAEGKEVLASSIKNDPKPSTDLDPDTNSSSNTDPDPEPNTNESICHPVIFSPGKALDNIDDLGIIRVAVIDTGVDPYYDYRSNSGSSMPDQADAFTFTEEVAYFQLGMSQLPSAYGAPITGSSADMNGNCLEADYYGYDYINDDSNYSGSLRVYIRKNSYFLA